MKLCLYPLQMWPWDPPGQTRTSRTGAARSQKSGHLCYQAHGGTRLGAPATRQLLYVGLARSPLGLRKAPEEDAGGERDFFDGFGFTCFFCVDPFDNLASCWSWKRYSEETVGPIPQESIHC